MSSLLLIQRKFIMSSNHSTPRRPLQRILAGTCALALGASLAACSASKESIDAAKPKDGDTVKAVATTTQICDYLTQIAAGGYLGEVVADLGSRGHGLDGVAVLRLCSVDGFLRGAASGEAGAECEGAGACENAL